MAKLGGTHSKANCPPALRDRLISLTVFAASTGQLSFRRGGPGDFLLNNGKKCRPGL